MRREHLKFCGGKIAYGIIESYFGFKLWDQQHLVNRISTKPGSALCYRVVHYLMFRMKPVNQIPILLGI